MAEIFRMPKLGMDMEVGLIGRWAKTEGETVKKGEILAEIETDKALVEVESTCDGTVLKLFLAEGDEAACGVPIAVIGQPGEAIPAEDSPSAVQDTPAVAPAFSAADILFRMPKLGMDGSGYCGQMDKSRGRHRQEGGALCGSGDRQGAGRSGSASGWYAAEDLLRRRR